MKTFTLYQLDRIYKIYKVSKNIFKCFQKPDSYWLEWICWTPKKKQIFTWWNAMGLKWISFVSIAPFPMRNIYTTSTYTCQIWRKHISGISFALLLAHEIPCWIQRSNGVEGPSDFLKQNIFTICGEKTTGLQVFGVPSFAAMEIQRPNEGEGTCRTVFFHNLGGTIQVGNPRGLKCSRSWGLKSKVFPAV
jgi:hypothetical protein